MRFQYSIRSALVFITVVGVLLAIRQSAVRKYESQRRAANRLFAAGAVFTVDPIRPAPLRWLVADSRLGPVTTVRLEECSDPGDSLGALADLPDLECLYMPNSTVRDDDLRHIAGLKKLRRLALWRTGITARGIRHLEDLENLELLYLFQLPITGVGFGKVRETCRLRYVDIVRCREFGEEGLEHLLRFRDLERVCLNELA